MTNHTEALARVLCRLDQNSDPDAPLTRLQPNDATFAWELYTDDAQAILASPVIEAIRAEGPQWLPIESAPKDGTFVLAVQPSGHIAIMQWCVDQFWRVRSDDPAHYWTPTHYMPLPAPPAIEARQDETIRALKEQQP